MSSWHPVIAKIQSIEKHPNADNLSIARVLGDFPVVIKTGQYQVGDLASYISVDSILPNIERYGFLSPMNFRQEEQPDGTIKNIPIGPKYAPGEIPEKYRIVKSKKIRSVYSEGLLEPAVPGLVEGDSVVEALGLTKWEEPEEDSINGAKLRGANAEKEPSHFRIPYYDLENLRKYHYLFKDSTSEEHPVSRAEVADNIEVSVTEKLHGCNILAIHDSERLWIKSRNFFKKPSEIDSWWEAARNENLETKLYNYPFLAFFGELIGLVKGFRYDTQVTDGKLITKIKFFDAYNTQTHKFLDYDEFKTICDEIGLETSPVLYRGPWTDYQELKPLAEGQSLLNPKHIREGFVVKPVKEQYSYRLQGRLVLKMVGEAYKLSK